MESLRQIFRSSPPTRTDPSGAPKLATPHNILPDSNTDSMPSSVTQITVLELFQSQGCDSCPPTNAFLISNFSNDPRILLLTYEVTYWDRLGWVDTFGDKRWDERQRDYAAFLGQRSVYTPQVIVDGGARPIASWRDLPRVLSDGQRRGPELKTTIVTREGRRMIEIDSVKENRDWNKAEVLAVWYEGQPADVDILRGENKGVTLPHRNVVRDLLVIGQYRSGKVVFEDPGDRRGLRMCVLVQAGRGGKILGAVFVS